MYSVRHMHSCAQSAWAKGWWFMNDMPSVYQLHGR